jgi:diacylglycerol kinase family enzyme
MGHTRRARVFLNIRSGIGGVSPETLCKRFALYGCSCDVTVLEPRLDLTTLAGRDAPEIVWVAAGGDGTVNCVANAIAGTPRVMGVLPVGTLNHFALDLGIPPALDEAIAVIATGPTRTVDAAEVNGIHFVNNSSLGVYPAMVLDRDRMRKGGANKWWSLVAASARAFFRFRCLAVELEVDGSVRHYTTPLLFVGNNIYCIEGGRLGRRERMDEGVLFLALVPSTTRLSMLRLLASALVGRAREASELEEFVVKTFTVTSTHRRVRVSFDGEAGRMRPPLRYTSRPGALHVIVPAEKPL